MKKLIGLGIAVAVIIALVTTGTFALFSDTETSTGNQFTAGVIDLEIDCDGDTVFSAMDDPLDKIFEYLPASDIKPGDSGHVTLSLHLKDGSNDADLWMQVLSLENFGGVCSEPECEEEGGTWNGSCSGKTAVDDDIANEILVKLWLDDGDNVYEPDSPEFETYLYDGTLSGLETAGQQTVKDDAVACTTYYVGWSWELPSAVGNEHQGDYCTFNVKFGADQVVTP